MGEPALAPPVNDRRRHPPDAHQDVDGRNELLTSECDLGGSDHAPLESPFLVRIHSMRMVCAWGGMRPSTDPAVRLGMSRERRARRSIGKPSPDDPGTIGWTHDRRINLEVVVTVSMAGGLRQFHGGDDIVRHRSTYLSPGESSTLPDLFDRTADADEQHRQTRQPPSTVTQDAVRL